jgi:hypothetical protein
LQGILAFTRALERSSETCTVSIADSERHLADEAVKKMGGLTVSNFLCKSYGGYCTNIPTSGSGMFFNVFEIVRLWAKIKQWGSEYWTSEYRNHFNTEQIEIRYSNGPVLRCPVPENQSYEYWTFFQMVELNTGPVFKW